MRKLISLILCIALLTSVFALNAISVSAKNVSPLFLDEEHDAQLNSTSDKLYYSYYSPIDCTYDFYSVSSYDLMVTVTDSEENVVATDDNSGGAKDFRATVYMNAGDTYFFEVSARRIDDDGRFSLYITQSTCSIKSLEVSKLPDKTEYEYGTIQYDIDYSGLELTITMKNGSQKQWCYNTDSKYIDGYKVMMSVDYDSTPPVVTVRCGSASDSFELSVKDSPIQSIEILNKENVYVYENCGGYFDTDEQFYYYYYDVPDFEIKITFTDGTTKQACLNELAVDLEFSIKDNQLSEHFTLGDNAVTIELMGATDEFYVTVLQTPVDSYEVVCAPTKEYIFGEQMYFYYNEYTDVYTLNALDLNGIEFTLNFKDGSSKSFTTEDVDHDAQTIAGESYRVLACSLSSSGQYDITLEYLGCKIQYQVSVVDYSTLLGDVDNDGTVSVLDATQIQLHLSQSDPIPQQLLANADTDHDGKTSVLDATQIQLYLAHNIDSL